MQVARLTLQPGDAVVISTDRHLNREQADQIRALTDRALPPDVKVIVLSGGLAMTVLRQGCAIPSSRASSDRAAVMAACDRRLASAGPAVPPTAPPGQPPRRP